MKIAVPKRVEFTAYFRSDLLPILGHQFASLPPSLEFCTKK
nr:MAG TPA: hypothetical protein [Caudoviricetes sp.]